jgi:hypothetical protein
MEKGTCRPADNHPISWTLREVVTTQSFLSASTSATIFNYFLKITNAL